MWLYLDDFIDPLTPLGLGLHAKNLYNDYVYFWRWALWKVFEQKNTPGIVSFITAASYLRGPGFAGMRKMMRETFDELWIIDLEGDNLGARKSENVFAIRSPVAIAIGVRADAPQPDMPAKVHYTRIDGTRQTKLDTLDQVNQFADLHWRDCFAAWTAPFLPATDTEYWKWPLLTDLFPWQTNGVKAGRPWTISETPDVLEQRWRTLLANKDRKALFKDSPTGRKAHQPAQPLPGMQTKTIAITQSLPSEPLPTTIRYAFRSFDRRWVIADARVLDRPSPTLWHAHGDKQIYMTSLLTTVLGGGPSAVVTDLIPDNNYFCNRGAKDVIPLWRDAAATEPNITAGVLQVLQTAYGQAVAPEDLFAYCYALLQSPQYVQTFWDELTIPGPRVPLTTDHALFAQAAALGRELINLHTYGERFVPPGKRAGSIPLGNARIAVGTPTNAADYPASFSYDAQTQELHVGKGVFSSVHPDVWNFGVSGLHVVRSWLGYRMRERAGKSSSPLDDIRPATWQFDDELLDLLWVLEATLARLPQATTLLHQVLAGPLLAATALPVPGDGERRGPKGAPTEQMTLDEV